MAMMLGARGAELVLAAILPVLFIHSAAPAIKVTDSKTTVVHRPRIFCLSIRSWAVLLCVVAGVCVWFNGDACVGIVGGCAI